jgi:type II secretory pathway component PulM
MSGNTMTAMWARWAALSSRERRGVLWGTGVLLVALTWSLAYEPAARGTTRLLADRPTWQADLARMDALVAQARQLAEASGAEPPALSTVRDALETSLRAAGWAAQLTSLKATPELIELRMSGVPVGPWLAWLESSLRESRLRVLELSLERPGPPAPSGTVSVRVVLDRPARTR